MGDARRILGCWKQKGRRENLVCLIFWICILKGESLDICWGHLSTPGVRREGRWERGGEEMDKREGGRDEESMEWRIKGGGAGMEGRRVGMEGRRKAGMREGWDEQRTLFCSPG